MDSRAAIHTAARRYCMERHAYWIDRESQEKSQNRWPRYRALEVLLTDIERFQPSDFANLANARRTLILATGSAPFEFDHQFTDDDQAAAAEEERELLSCYLSLLGDEELSVVEPLPHRRVLSKLEAINLREQLEGIWGRWDGGSPDREPDAPVMTIRNSAFNSEQNLEQLRRLLLNHDQPRLWELRELVDGFELDSELLNPVHNSDGEAMWSAGEMDWMIYVSRNDTITFAGGWLVDFLRLEFRRWPQWLVAR